MLPPWVPSRWLKTFTQQWEVGRCCCYLLLLCPSAAAAGGGKGVQAVCRSKPDATGARRTMLAPLNPHACHANLPLQTLSPSPLSPFLLALQGDVTIVLPNTFLQLWKAVVHPSNAGGWWQLQ